jgi:signal transduction histidine kinase
MRSGKRSVKVKIFLLLVAPLVSVVGLWIFAAGVTGGEARANLRTDTVATNFARPLRAVGNQLTEETVLSVVSMTTRGSADAKGLTEQRAKTDGSIAALRASGLTEKVRGAISPTMRTKFESLLSQFDGLGELRRAIDSGAKTPVELVAAYGGMWDAYLQLQDDVGAVTLLDRNLYRRLDAMYQSIRAQDMIGREEALLVGSLSPSGSGSLSPEVSRLFSQYVASRRTLLAVALPKDAIVSGFVTPVLRSSGYAQLGAIEDRVAATPAGAPLDIAIGPWRAAADTVRKQIQDGVTKSGFTISSQTTKAGRAVLVRLGLAGGLGVLAVALSLLLSIRVGRGLTRELTGLQGAAHDLANQRLPGIIDRLRRDELVDIEAEAPPLEVGDTAEVAKVSEALTTVQRTAIEAAIGQANLRRGVRQVFLNLARRSQSLLHRQLTMLDSMERKTSDPDALEELFKLDHLTTRMRRHAEGLIILSGALPARAWSTPVRVVDVVRAAIAEVESYTRVRVFVLSEASLQGAAVADVTHLIAELVENAASFSPPHTQVQVRAEAVSNGFVIEIEDAGLGMNSDQLAEVNERLAKPPDFDLADTDRLGLFVVAQLAARHNIKVTLRSSPYGGTTAIVLMPAEMMAQDALSGPQDAVDGRWTRMPSRRGPAGGPADLDRQLSAIVDVGPDAPALTGRHRRIAGFLQRTRELQSPPPPPRESPEWLDNGWEHGPGNNRDTDWDTGRDTGRNTGRDADRAPAWEHGGNGNGNGNGRDAGRDPGPAAGRPAGWDNGPPPGWDNGRQPGQDAGRQPGQDAGRDPGRDAGWQPGQDNGRPRGWDNGNGRDTGHDPGREVRRDPGPAAGPAAGDRDWDSPKFDLWATTESAATSAGTHAGLPRRVRRASLAPQLRDTPAPGPDDVDQNTDTLRSPEQARALMTSLQNGWQRGRTEPDPGMRPTEETR